MTSESTDQYMIGLGFRSSSSLGGGKRFWRRSVSSGLSSGFISEVSVFEGLEEVLIWRRDFFFIVFTSGLTTVCISEVSVFEGLEEVFIWSRDIFFIVFTWWGKEILKTLHTLWVVHWLHSRSQCLWSFRDGSVFVEMQCFLSEESISFWEIDFYFVVVCVSFLFERLIHAIGHSLLP